jgi:hypothetical protein
MGGAYHVLARIFCTVVNVNVAIVAVHKSPLYYARGDVGDIVVYTGTEIIA